MADFSWLEKEDELTSEALTVRAQAISPNDDGTLLWDAFLPRMDVDSVKIDEITSLDFRPAADRREWNQSGRVIPLKTPDMRAIEMVPIESRFHLGEREIQALSERTMGNEDLFRRIVMSRIPDRVDSLVMADYRRLEVDAMEAWSKGQVTVMNPETGTTYTAAFGFPATRLQTAGTAWDVAANAYNEFLAWLEDAIDAIGPLSGAMMRLATLQVIQADAPNPLDRSGTVQPTRTQLQQRLQDELGMPFTLYVNERTVDVFSDGGKASARTKIWPAQYVAAVPAGTAVGQTAFAPVARAMELDARVPAAGIDVRGVTVYHNAGADGKSLEIEAQVNAMPVPDEQRVFTIDAGV